MIKFQPIEKTDLKYIIQIRNKYKKYLRQWKLQSIQEQIKWYENLPLSDHVFYSIYENDLLIGALGFTYIDWQNRKCELSFITEHYVDKNSIEIVQKALDIAFKEWNLNKVWVEVFEFDELKKRLLNKMEFMNEAILLDAYFNERWYDSVIFTKFQNKWSNSQIYRNEESVEVFKNG